MTMAESGVNCDFCSKVGCYLGVKNLCKATDQYLSDILKQENIGNAKKKKQQQKIGHKLMSQNDKDLIKIFNLGEGFRKQKFNNLALDKLRTDKDNAEDLGTIL